MPRYRCSDRTCKYVTSDEDQVSTQESCPECGALLEKAGGREAFEPPSMPGPLEDKTLERLAAEVLLVEIESELRARGEPEASVKERAVERIFERSLRDYAEVAKFVNLAAAKRAYEEWRPEAKHGAATGGGKRKIPKVESFVNYACVPVGVAANTLSEWCRIGGAIVQGAYDLVLGTPLANKRGHLDRLAALAPSYQLYVAALNRREPGRALKALASYYQGTEVHKEEEHQAKERRQQRVTETFDAFGENIRDHWGLSEMAYIRERYEAGGGVDDCPHCHGSGTNAFNGGCNFPGCTVHTFVEGSGVGIDEDVEARPAPAGDPASAVPLTQEELREISVFLGPVAYFTEHSHNPKLAPVKMEPDVDGGRPHYKAGGEGGNGPFVCTTHVAMTPTCPSSCPFLGTESEPGGCYALAGGDRKAVADLNAAARARGLSADDVTRHEVRAIDAAFEGHFRIPKNGGKDGKQPLDLRLHISGDVGGEGGARMLAKAIDRWRERGGGAVWTYTHRWRTIPREAWGRINVLASVDRPDEIELARERGYASAIVVDRFRDTKTFTLDGHDIVACPAETKDRTGVDATCVDCRLCLDHDLIDLGLTIGFEAHGPRKSQAIRALEILRDDTPQVR